MENADGKGFVLTLNEEIIEEFTIKYSTKPTDLVTGTIDVKNEVIRSDRETDPQHATAYYSQNVLSKSNSNINYQAKTVDWKIVLNSARYTMDNIVLTDTFVHKNLKIIDSSFKVMKGSTLLGSGTDYTRTDINSDGTELDEGDKKGGFILSIPGQITEPVTITFTTEYDVRGVTNLDQYVNTASLTWKTGGKDYSTADVTSTVKINTQQPNKGYKTGNYNYETKKFQWSVGINYNFDTIANPVFTDTLSDSQVLDRDSIKVHKLNLSGGGNGVIVGDPLEEGTDYTLTPAELENTFTITFLNAITEAYRINYESQNKDDYYAPTGTNHSVTNDAQLNGGTYGKWSKTVTVSHTINTNLSRQLS